jgi:hypothetical protein
MRLSGDVGDNTPLFDEEVAAIEMAGLMMNLLENVEDLMVEYMDNLVVIHWSKLKKLVMFFLKFC